MAQAKKRGLWLFGTLWILAVPTAVVTGSIIAWSAVGGLTVALLAQVAAPIDDDPDVPHNPAKLPLFVAGLLVGLVAATAGVVTEVWGYAAAGAVLIGLCVPSIVVIRRGENPWWLRAWADYWRR